MQGFWFTLGWGLASLLAVSVLVAVVEYLRQGAQPRQPVESPMPRALNIDLDLDAPPPEPASTAPLHDADTRRAALSEVLQRLQQAGPDAAWIETTPMVLAPKSDATAT